MKFMEELMGVFLFSSVLGNTSQSIDINNERGLKEKLLEKLDFFSFVL